MHEWLGDHDLRETRIKMVVFACVVLEARLSQEAARRDEAIDCPLRLLMPSNIEGGEIGKELEIAVGQMVMDPPGHGLPRRTGPKTVDQPGHYDACDRAHAAVRAAPIPGMTSPVLLIRGAAEPVGAAKGVDLRRPVGRADSQAPECRLQRFQEIFAKTAAGGDREIEIIGEVRHSFDCGDLAVKKVAHEEGPG